MAERFPIENLKVVGNDVYRVAPDGRMQFVRSLAHDPTANTDVFAATPPRADAPSFHAATPKPEHYFGESAVGMAAPYLQNAYDLATTANTMTPDESSYVPVPVQRMGHAATNMGLAGLSALMAPVYGAAGAVGDVANAAGVPRAGALVNDLGAMIDSAGILPEGRILGAMTEAGAVPKIAEDLKGVGKTVAERANQRGPMPTVYSNPIPGIGDNGGPALDIFETPTSALAPRQKYVDPTTGRYSKAFEAAHDLKQDVMTPAQARAGLLNQGVKEDELLYTGFDNWLKGKDKVTKDEVINILGDIAINKSGEGALPFNRITHEGTGIAGGAGDQQLADLRDQIYQDRIVGVDTFVNDYRNTLQSNLKSQGVEPIVIKSIEDFYKVGDLIDAAFASGKPVNPSYLRLFESVQNNLNRGYDFNSYDNQWNIKTMQESGRGGYLAPDGSIISESNAFEDYLPEHNAPDTMRNRMEYELQNEVERMDAQQVADYLGLNVDDLLPTFDPGTTNYAEYGPKGLMDYRENRYGYNDAGRGVLSGSESELGTQSYREGHFPKGSQDENRMYHTRAGMLNTPEGNAYLAFELQSDIGQAYRSDPSQFHVTGTNPTFEIPKSSKKGLQEYVTVGKKYQSLKDQEAAAMNVLYTDQYLDPKTQRFMKEAPGFEDLTSHIRDLRAKRDAVSQQLMDIEKANNDVIDGMQRFYGRPGMSIRTADAYGQDFDVKSVEEALAGGLKPKEGAMGSPKGKISTRPFTTSTNRWVPAALKDELFNAANSDAEWFSLPLGKDVESWTYGESAGQADFYENIVPTQLKKLLKKEFGLDVPIQKIKAEGFLKRDNPTYEVNAIRLTPELKKLILEQGFSTFKKGGPVVGSSLDDVDVFALP